MRPPRFGRVGGMALVAGTMFVFSCGSRSDLDDADDFQGDDGPTPGGAAGLNGGGGRGGGFSPGGGKGSGRAGSPVGGTGIGGRMGRGGNAGAAGRVGRGGSPAAGRGGSPPVAGGGSGGAPGKAGSCCSAHASPGCSNQRIAQCVCNADSFCCEERWDLTCVNEVDTLNCGACGSNGGSPGVGGASTGGVGGSPVGVGGGGGLIELICQDPTRDVCAQCLCTACYDTFGRCIEDPGCVDIVACIASTGCGGDTCYLDTVCGGVMDAFGGPLAPSTVNAASFAACSRTTGCPCF